MKRLLLFPVYFLIFASLISCGSNSHTASDKGSISFNLTLKHTTIAPRSAHLPGNDICIDYGITTINATVLNSSGATVTSVSWPCSAHSGTITGVPAGSNYTVRLEGIDSNSAVAWKGEISGISVNKGSTTSAGTITMTYIGSDTTAPTITTTNPSDNATNAPVTTLLTATFSKQLAVSSINTETFTVKIDTTPVSGSVTYDSNTKKAIFIPSTNLSYSTTYAATITTDVEDMAGNNMQSDYSWSFTTENPPTSAPSAPTGVNATAGNNQVTITWDAVPGATSYNIYWSTTTGVTKATGTQISGITTTSYTHTGLTNSTTYYYVVTAVNSFGESTESIEVFAKLKWVEITVDQSIYFRNIYFVNTNVGWVIGAKQIPPDTREPEQRILKTSDGGNTWVDQSPINQIGYLFGIYFIDPNYGWVGGGTGSGWQIHSTSDGGNTWSTHDLGGVNVIHDIHATDSNNVWVVGDSSQVLYSFDGFQTFITQNVVEYPGGQIWNIDMLNSSVGYLATPNDNKIYKTADGGNNWTLIYTTSSQVYTLDFINENEGWVAGDNKTIFHTTDGGQSWTLQTVPTSQQQIQGISFVDSKNGWLNTSGYGGEIWGTKDGGITWTLEYTAPSNTVLSKTFFVDANHGWVACSNGKIIKYEESQ